MNEEWREVPCLHEYQVSALGRIHSDKTDRILKPSCGMGGYLRVGLYSNGKSYGFGTHVLVALAFMGPYRQGFEVCHVNNIPWDNRLSNLKYDTLSANRKARRPMGEGFVVLSRDLKRLIARKSFEGSIDADEAKELLRRVKLDYKKRKAERLSEFHNPAKARCRAVSQPSLSVSDLASMIRLRESGLSLRRIGERFDVSESYVCYIFKGRRLADKFKQARARLSPEQQPKQLELEAPDAHQRD